MASRLCPYCMRTANSDTCPHCGRNIHYTGSPAHLPAGYVISGKHPYVLGAALGQGGFGITYIALDMVTHQRVAIKEYYPGHYAQRTDDFAIAAIPDRKDPFLMGRGLFLKEAEKLQSLSDLESIVKVLDIFQANNTAYLVMEFLEGSSLMKYAQKNGKFPAQSFLEQITPLLKDIQKMHDRGVYHLEISPHTILLLPDGRMKLFDFGPLHYYLNEYDEEAIVWDPFSPIEFYMCQPPTAATDLYSLAGTIYCCITGKGPVRFTDRRSGNGPLEAPSDLGADTTWKQDHAFFSALEIEPSQRTQSVQRFLEAVTQKAPSPVFSYSGNQRFLPDGTRLYGGSQPYFLGTVLTGDRGTNTYSAYNMVTGALVVIRELYPGRRITGTQSQLKRDREHEAYFLRDKKRFLNDAWKLKQLNHLHHIVKILDYFEENNTAYMVMEPLDAITLRDFVQKNGKFPARSFLKQILPLMDDIYQMHQRGIQHPNISPDHILLLPNGQLKLAGLSADYNSYWEAISDDGLDFFALCFRSLEELQSGSSVTPSANVYSLAATIYYCITGKLPADAQSREHFKEPLESPSKLCADITKDQEAALLRALNVPWTIRTGSMQEFRKDLTE